MTYYLYLGVPIVVATVTYFIYSNYAKTYLKSKDELLYEYYNSLSNDKQREIDIKIQFARDVREKKIELNGKTFDEVTQLCENNFCQFRPSSINGSYMYYIAVYRKGDLYIDGVVENDIVISCQVEDLCI